MKKIRVAVVLLTGLFSLMSSALAADPPKVLILLADGFNRGEHYQSYMPLKALGYQAVWAFPRKTAGAYSGDPVVETDERLLSVESAAVLQQALAAK